MDYGLTDILRLLGSLGLFLYGMKVMSDALMALAGDRMRGILATYSSAHVGWLPSDPQHIFITIGLITILGILLQWTFFRKAADK